MFDALTEVSAVRSRLTRVREAALSEAECIDLVRGLEELKAAAAAAQAEAAAKLDRMRRDREALAGMPERHRGAGVAAEIALARRESPSRGARHLGLAKALVSELQHTHRALQSGLVSEWQATIVARETACLTVEDRREVDAILAADASKTQGWGDRRLAAETMKHAARLDAQSVVRRAAKAASERRVSCRPAPDAMGRLSALLPVAQAVALIAALGREADKQRATGESRTRSQVMADTLFERVTGNPAEQPARVEVKLVLTDRALFAGHGEPAWLEGYGTVPAEVARRLVGDAARGLGAWFRALYTHPVTGELVAMSSRRRTAPRGLADFIDTRDQTCRTPYCDAPIRHHDHVWAAAANGPTSSENLQGLCEACNYAKQAPGWRARARPGLRHLVVITTPTGHVYQSQAPPLPGHEPSRGETYSLATMSVGLSEDYGIASRR